MNLVSHIFFLFLSNFSELRIDHHLDYTSTSRPPNFLHRSWLLLHLPRDLPSLLGNKVKTQKYLKKQKTSVSIPGIHAKLLRVVKTLLYFKGPLVGMPTRYFSYCYEKMPGRGNTKDQEPVSARALRGCKGSAAEILVALSCGMLAFFEDAYILRDQEAESD